MRQQSSIPVDRVIESLCGTLDSIHPVPCTLVVVAHPDDEVVGAGARFTRLKEAYFLHITDGAPRNMYDATRAGFRTRHDYARARREELYDALALAGIPPDCTYEAGVADQESAFNLVYLAQQVRQLLLRLQPAIVLTQPYEGGHPDHDSAAFAVHAACRLLEQDGQTPPAVVEMTAYHIENGEIATFSFLPNAGCRVTTSFLPQPLRRLKRRMINCFRTQVPGLRTFPLRVERFRPAPLYNFTEPPHDGRLFYEYFNWGTTGPEWRHLAGRALDQLGIKG